jgi:4-amino-4-deoxy-L-arabinose transferase-like glycosyltransferase
MIFGAHQWVTVLCAMLLFFVTYFITCGLAEGLAGSPAVRVAAPVLALWPGYLTVVGINSKEALLACLVTGAMLLYLRGTDRGRSGLLYFAAAGACIGFATLTQPGYMLFPGVILCYELLRSRGIWKSLGYTALFTLALVAVVAPWTYRNYLTFHRPVIVSTNGGSVFYRANNPDANASYAAEGANPLPQDEFAADKQGYKEAEAWIAHHPLDFLTLAVRKQVVYLGDDGIGIYESLKRDQNPPKLLYAALKAICSLYWIILWIVLLFAFINFPARTQSFTVYCLCAFPVVYQWGIDSVFESGSRHHIAYVGLIAALFGAVVANFPSGQEAPNQTGASLIQS